jgi:hypothetical protein
METPSFLFPIWILLLGSTFSQASNNTWTTASLSQTRIHLVATSVGNLALFAGGNIGINEASAVVDIYSYSNNTWTNASLSQTRYALAATSVGNLALFAGGIIGVTFDESFIILRLALLQLQ